MNLATRSVIPYSFFQLPDEIWNGRHWNVRWVPFVSKSNIPIIKKCSKVPLKVWPPTFATFIRHCTQQTFHPLTHQTRNLLFGIQSEVFVDDLTPAKQIAQHRLYWSFSILFPICLKNQMRAKKARLVSLFHASPYRTGDITPHLDSNRMLHYIRLFCSFAHPVLSQPSHALFILHTHLQEDTYTPHPKMIKTSCSCQTSDRPKLVLFKQ